MEQKDDSDDAVASADDPVESKNRPCMLYDTHEPCRPCNHHPSHVNTDTLFSFTHTEVYPEIESAAIK